MVATQLLFLHGWTMHGGIFNDLISRLGDGYVCAAPNFPGHGTSSLSSPGLNDCVKVINSVLDSLEPGPVVVVGWSMGAAAAWRYFRHVGTKRVAGLVTVDMSPRLLPGKNWPHGLKGQTPETIAESTARFEADWEGATQSIAATMFATPEGPPGFGRDDALRLIRSHNPDNMRGYWHELVALDERAVISTIDIPYLVCSGLRSRVYPESASRWIAAQAPKTRQIVFTESGHSPHLEEPSAFARALVEFTKEI